MSWFNKVISSVSGGASAPAKFTAPLAPERPFFAIGDVHGHFSAFDSLLNKIENLDGVDPVVCVGDYMDRGEYSAHILTWSKHLTELYPDLFICLMGNHEKMCLDFIDDPERNGERWLRYGGLQTLSSFGIAFQHGESQVSLRDKLVREMGTEMVDWLRNLPLKWRSGNVVVVHAGADPDLPIDEQPNKTLLWGHPDFEKKPRKDGLWIVHGHTIVDDPLARDGRISVDTGAYATGCLTAARITAEGVSFINS